MKRELRAWNPKRKSWEGGTFLNWRGDSFVWVDGKRNTHMPDTLKEIELITQFEVGVNDINGAQIFEGDIVSMPNRPNMVVEFNVDICCYILRYGKGQFVRMEVVKDKILVVGNIFENPEMISL